MQLQITESTSPLGDVRLATSGGRVYALALADHWPRLHAALQRRVGAVELRSGADAADVRHRLDDYFAGDLAALHSIEVELIGTTFQCRVWNALRTIPVGHTATYGDIARRIGAPTAVRAVGAANGANPIWIVIPCHRVIGADGELTGYGGGLERKRWLLMHEGALAAECGGGTPSLFRSSAAAGPTSSETPSAPRC